jgi:hypothetical protein
MALPVLEAALELPLRSLEVNVAKGKLWCSIFPMKLTEEEHRHAILHEVRSTDGPIRLGIHLAVTMARGRSMLDSP